MSIPATIKQRADELAGEAEAKYNAECNRIDAEHRERVASHYTRLVELIQAGPACITIAELRELVEPMATHDVGMYGNAITFKVHGCEQLRIAVDLAQPNVRNRYEFRSSRLTEPRIAICDPRNRDDAVGIITRHATPDYDHD